MTKLEIYNECAKNPKEMFDFLRRDDFRMAKEFWPEDEEQLEKLSRFGNTYYPDWMACLEKLILSPDPLAYMRGFLSEVPDREKEEK